MKETQEVGADVVPVSTCLVVDGSFFWVTLVGFLHLRPVVKETESVYTK